MANTLTYNQLLTVFNNIGNDHLQIKRVGNGMIEDVNTFSPKDVNFPIMWVTPQSAQLGRNSLLYTFRVLVFDIDDEDDDHRNEILSDTLSILNDIIVQLNNDDDDYYVSNTPTAIPFTQRFVDYCSGWYADVEIEVAIMNARCQVPTI